MRPQASQGVRVPRCQAPRSFFEAAAGVKGAVSTDGARVVAVFEGAEGDELLVRGDVSPADAAPEATGDLWSPLPAAAAGRVVLPVELVEGFLIGFPRNLGRSAVVTFACVVVDHLMRSLIRASVSAEANTDTSSVRKNRRARRHQSSNLFIGACLRPASTSRRGHLSRRCSGWSWIELLAASERP
jgi:hypothetical protein